MASRTTFFLHIQVVSCCLMVLYVLCILGRREHTLSHFSTSVQWSRLKTQRKWWLKAWVNLYWNCFHNNINLSYFSKSLFPLSPVWLEIVHVACRKIQTGFKHLTASDMSVVICQLINDVTSADIMDVSTGRLLPTTLIKLVDLQLVNGAERGCLAQLYFLAVFRNNGWLPIFRVGVPKHIHATL